MAEKENKMIGMIFDEGFYGKMGREKWGEEEQKKGGEYYEKVVEL